MTVLIMTVAPNALTDTATHSGVGGPSRAFDATPAYWFSMLAASALGTNLGDLGGDYFGLGETVSFGVLAATSAAAIWGDGRRRGGTEIFYWTAIVVLRAAATNVGDFMTHDLALDYAAVALVWGVATLVAGQFTHIDKARASTPDVDGRYWCAMLIAGVFGTVAGDLASHSIGLYAAAFALCALLVVALALRSRFAATSLVAYWCVILAERCAGTPVGDSLASHRGVGLGVPVAMVCSGGLLAAGLVARTMTRRAPVRG